MFGPFGLASPEPFSFIKVDGEGEFDLFKLQTLQDGDNINASHCNVVSILNTTKNVDKSLFLGEYVIVYPLQKVSRRYLMG